MKIAFLNKYQGKAMRGAETFVYELAKRLSKKHKVDVVSDVNYLKLYQNKYDVIIPTNGRWQVLIVRIIAFLSGAKIVVSGQSGIGFDDRVNLLAFPHVFVALTKFQRNWARRANPFVKIETIPNGVDLQKFYPNTNAKTRRPKTILAVGAFTQAKGHMATIAAVAKIDNAKLLIVGSGGDQKEDIEKTGKRVLGDRFETKSVSFSEMPNVYRSADVFVYPTVPWESFGIAIVEALATGLPVVVSDDPIRREIVGDAGYFINPTETINYAAAIKAALNLDDRGKAIRQAKKYDWDKIGQLYEDLLSKLVGFK